MIENYISSLQNFDLVLFFVGSLAFFIIFGQWKKILEKLKDTEFWKNIFVSIGKILFFYLMSASFLKILEKLKTFSTTNLDLLHDIFIGILWLFIIKILIQSFINLYLLPKAVRTKSKVDNSFLPIIEKLIIMVLYIVFIIFVLEKYGVNTSSIIASLGVGGLAIAIASQQTFSNMFGTISIVTDDMFEVGDYIKLFMFPIGVEGIVKQIGLRSTRIIGKTGEEMIIPNAEIQARVIANLGRRAKRRVEWVFNLPLDTPKDKIKLAKKIIFQAIKTAGIKNNEDEIIVSLKEIGEKSFKIFAIFYIITQDYESSVKIRGNINTIILDGFEREKISLIEGKNSQNIDEKILEEEDDPTT